MHPLFRGQMVSWGNVAVDGFVRHRQAPQRFLPWLCDDRVERSIGAGIRLGGVFPHHITKGVFFYGQTTGPCQPDQPRLYVLIQI